MASKKYFLTNLVLVLMMAVLSFSCNESTEPNHNPVVNSIVAFPNAVQFSDSFAIFCSADDVDGDPLTYDWECTNHGASIKGTSSENPFKLTNTNENFRIFNAIDSIQYETYHAAIFCDVRDGKGGFKTVTIIVPITKKNN